MHVLVYNHSYGHKYEKKMTTYRKTRLCKCTREKMLKKVKKKY